MPRFSRQRRRTPRRRRVARKKYAKRVFRIARRAAFSVQETKESRFAHTSVGGVNFSSISYGTGAVVAGLFGTIASGTGQNQRIGNSVFARGFRWYLALQPGDSTNYLRMLVVSAKQGTPVQPSLTANFVASVLSNGASGSTQWSFPVDTMRWHVHVDRTFTLRYFPETGNTASVLPQMKITKGFVKLKRKIFWDDTNTINNDLYLLMISDSAAAPNPGAVAGFFNIYFKDA